MSDILGLVAQSLASEDDEDIKKMLGGLKTLLGGESSACVIGEWKGGGFSGPALVINESFPAGWLQRYADGELYRECPVILDIRKRPGPYLFDAGDGFWGTGEVCHSCRAEESGLRHVLASTTYDKGTGLASVFSVSAPPGSFFERHLSIAEILTPSVHTALERVYGAARSGAKVTLTKREMQVMKWVGEGKTNWEIAMILSISERTVKFHNHNILEKLGAVNKAHAVAIATGKKTPRLKRY